MSLTARLRIAIVALAAIVVVALSGLYLYDFGRLAFQAAHARAELVATEVQDYVVERVAEQMELRPQRAQSEEEFRQLATKIIRFDPKIIDKLRRSAAAVDELLDVEITDANGQVLAAFNQYAVGKPQPPAHDFETLHTGNAFRDVWDLFRRRENYATAIPLGIDSSHPSRPAFQVRVIVRSFLLRRALMPAFANLAVGFLISLATAMLLAALVPGLVLGPLERVGRSIERITAGDADLDAPVGNESAEFAAVHSKLNVLGQQYRGVRQDALELRSNIEQLLRRLDEAVLLLDADGRLMMAGQSVERLVGKPRHEIVGRKVEEIFARSTGFGRAIIDAVVLRRPWNDHLLEFQRNGAPVIRVLVSVEPLETVSGGNVGTLIRLRDADTRRQLAAHLDLSSRLAALGRLTSGVAHEIKNPLNAMALHLEVLRTKLHDDVPEIGVISREIKRLDHVIKTFLNFNRPVELEMRTLDLAAIARDITALVLPDATAKGITVDADLKQPAWISGDPGLVNQAILNVVVNAIEAMGDGGRMAIRTNVSESECAVIVTDNGPGIPSDVQDRIFNLYFSTKENGSGIGLAMTFRVVQLHSGTIDLVSEQGQGTSFRLRFPRLAEQQDEGLAKAAGSRRM